ncbi:MULTISPECIES: hypothetical protein [unclassified Amycolatopsis]|uniref:hypothetical protein n=1 Tax=unclassified Amycolatopsis TaxID=2618356 RepID=UPI001C6A3612|nr:hypothetical protein [Amycolatopsis sp. DSM 110486]QYN23012.1 hypothetical protein K1T34_11390 [Amycolatopsis sp. DSM 110486]
MGSDPKIVSRYTRPEVGDPETRARDLGELVAERFKWAQLAVVPGQFNGWDVAVRIDGSYSSLEAAMAAMEHLAHRAAKVDYLDGDDAQ